MAELERREARLTLRASAGRTLYGMACPFEVWAEVGPFREQVARSAFDRSLGAGAGEILLMKDHNPADVLARTANHSLRLENRVDGLHFAAELIESTLCNDVLAAVRANLAGGCSIGFRVRGDRWNGTREERILTDIELIEISLVSAIPIYPTTVAARSRQGASRRRQGLDPLIWRYGPR